MGKIKKITENELVGGTQSTDVYPVTSVKAVYDESNERLDNILNRRGVVNISTNYNADHIAEVLTLEQAIAKVPSSDRTLGFVMTFLTSSGWETYQFTGDSLSNWSSQENWIVSLNSGNLEDSIGKSDKYAMSQKAICNLIGVDEIGVFSKNLSYSVGDVVNYNGTLYEFIKNHSGEWSDSSVRKSSLRHDYSSWLSEDENLLKDAPTLAGYYDSKGDLISNSGFIAIDKLIPVVGGGKYLYRGGMFAALKLVIYDSRGKVIHWIGGSGSTAYKTCIKVFTIPDNGRYIKVSSSLSNESLPIGLFEMKSMSNTDEVRVSTLAGEVYKKSNLIDSGPGYYTIVEDTLQYVQDDTYEYHRYKNTPYSIYKIFTSAKDWYIPLPAICINDGHPIEMSITDGESLFSTGGWDEIILQTVSGSEVYIEPVTTLFGREALIGGGSNIIKYTDISSGFFENDSGQVKENFSRVDFIKAKVHLEAGKIYAMLGWTGGNAKCFITKRDSLKIEQEYSLNGNIIYIGNSVTSFDLYYSSIITTSNIGSPAPIGVYEVFEPVLDDALIYFKSNESNFKYGWYDVNTLAFNEQSELGYCYSTPIAVKGGQKLRYYGSGYKALGAVLSCTSEGTPDGVLKISTESLVHNAYVKIDFVVPEDVSYIIIQSKITNSSLEGGEDYPHTAYLLDVGQVDYSYIPVTWTIPSKIYAIKGQEKSIYFDNIVNRNEDAPAYVIEVNKSFGDVDGRRFYFTPSGIGTKTITFNAWGFDNQLLSTKTVTIEIIEPSISVQKRVVCIGDSITEGRGEGDTNTNMPYHIKKGLDAAITGSENIIFVGSKGDPVRHEGWWGKSYQWLANVQKDAQESPLVNPETDELDIHYYRTQKCGLAEAEYIDVVSLAMGFNNTDTQSNADTAFSSMQSIIAAFKKDNPNTKFIIHLVTYPAMGNVEQPNEEQKIDKKNSLYYFRQLCIAAYNNNQDNNIFIGDLGLGYDRWYAYIRKTVHPAPYYDEDNMQVITDRVHPSYRGAKQMGENIMHSILKAALM